MCERARLLLHTTPAVSVLCAALVVGLPAGRARAQTQEDYRARIDQLLPLWREALRAEREEEARRRAEFDTLRAGTVALLAVPGDTQFVAEVARRVWERLAPVLGPDTLVLRSDLIFLRSHGNRTADRFVGEGVPLLGYGPDDRTPDVVNSVVEQFGRRLAVRLDDETSSWLGAYVPLERLPRGARERVYVQLATADSRAVRMCFRGDLPSCRDALALAEIDDPMVIWYSPEERRRLVERRRWHHSDPRRNRWLQARVRECLSGGSDRACLDVLHTLPALAFVYRPLWPNAHRMLLDLALELGGDGAYTRLLKPGTSDIEARLTQVAGVDLDSLVAVWRHAVLASRPERPRVTGLTGLSAVAWILLLALAASRSTRWR